MFKSVLEYWDIEALFLYHLSLLKTGGAQAHLGETVAAVDADGAQINPPATRSFGGLTVPLATMTVDTALVGHFSFAAIVANPSHNADYLITV